MLTDRKQRAFSKAISEISPTLTGTPTRFHLRSSQSTAHPLISHLICISEGEFFPYTHSSFNLQHEGHDGMGTELKPIGGDFQPVKS